MPNARVLTAAALFALFLPALFWLPQPLWAFLLALTAAFFAWVWGGWGGLEARGRLFYVGLVFVIPIVLVFSWHQFRADFMRVVDIHLFILLYFWLMSLFWCLIVSFWLWGRWPLNRSVWGRCLLLFLGGILILGTWIIFYAARGPVPFPGSLLCVLGMVWVAELSARFAARKKFIGRKSGMLVGVFFYGLLMLFLAFMMEAELTRFLVDEVFGGLPFMALYFLFLGVLCVLGDRSFSLLKHQAGRAGRFLPENDDALEYIGCLMAVLPGVAPMLAFFGYGGFLTA